MVSTTDGVTLDMQDNGGSGRKCVLWWRKWQYRRGMVRKVSETWDDNIGIGRDMG